MDITLLMYLNLILGTALAGLVVWRVVQFKRQQKHQANLEEGRAKYRKTVYDAWDTVHWVYSTAVSELLREGEIAEALAKLGEAELLVTDACHAEPYARCARSTSQLLFAMQQCAVLKTAILQAQQAAILANAPATPTEQTDGLLATP